MIYIKQYNSLFDSPRVQEPAYRDYLQQISFEKVREPFEKWLSSKIEVIGDHTWQDLQEVIEGVDYEIRYRVNTESYLGSGSGLFKTFQDAEAKFQQWSKYNGLLQTMTYTPTRVAIPITPKPETTKKGIDLEELEKRFDAFFENETEETFNAWLKKKGYAKTDDLGVKEADLLKPRYKVLTDYPRAVREVGYVITEFHARMISFYDKYPHLFKKLEWWEEREPNELPKYVMVVKNADKFGLPPNCIREVNEWHRLHSQLMADCFPVVINATCLMPSTKEEYNRFMSNQTPNRKARRSCTRGEGGG